MQQRRLRARAVASIAACTLLLAGLLGLRHETVVAHVRDHTTGALHHAHQLAEHHELDTAPHLHGRDVEAHDETGACALLAGLDKAPVLPSTPRALAVAPVTILASSTVIATEPDAGAIYRLAPKTSPPPRALA